MIANIIKQKYVLVNNNTGIIPVYRGGELDNAGMIVGRKMLNTAIRAAYKIDSAIASTWEK
jgi:hypothetical protein